MQITEIDGLQYKVGAHKFVYFRNNGAWQRSSKTKDCITKELIKQEKREKKLLEAKAKNNEKQKMRYMLKNIPSL